MITYTRLKFWDEVDQFPALHVNAGAETREYQSAGYKDRFLSVTIRIYKRRRFCGSFGRFNRRCRDNYRKVLCSSIFR